MEEKKYHALVHDKIFMGGASDVECMVKGEHIDVVVDLREEASACAYPEANVEWIQVPLGDNSETPQEQLFKQAVQHVTTAYKQGKKVAFHCGGGKGRTGAVAIGTLIELGQYNSIEQAEEAAKHIRSVISIRQPQREALEKLYKR
jgi:protein-tyrosine phosphatase